MLTKLIGHNDQVPLRPCVPEPSSCAPFARGSAELTRCARDPRHVPPFSDDLTRFHSRSPPGISVVDYLRRIVRYTNIEVRPHSRFCACATNNAER